MATITITAGPVTVTKTVSAQHLARFTAALHLLYPNTVTDQDAATAWANSVFDNIKDLVRQQEARVAANAAVNQVTPIDLT